MYNDVKSTSKNYNQNTDYKVELIFGLMLYLEINLL